MLARLAFVVLLASEVPLLFASSPAAALSCASLSDKRAFEGSSAVFSGQLVASEEVGQSWAFGTAVSTFTVERVFKGKLDLTVKVLSRGDDSVSKPSPQRVLVYAADLDRPGRTALLERRIFELDKELSGIQRPLQEADARLNATADQKARAKLQGLRAVEAGNLIRPQEALDQQKAAYVEQLTALSRADVTLQFTACGASVRQLPISSSLGKGVEPRGNNTDDQPPPPEASWSDPDKRWLAVAAALGPLAFGIWALTKTRRRQYR